MSLKEILDNRVRRYRAKYFRPPNEIVYEVSERCAKVTWSFLKMIIFFSQNKDNQVVVYLGVKTFYETREQVFVHKLRYLGNVYQHFYPLKYPKETLDMIRYLAQKDGFRVADPVHSSNTFENGKNIDWKMHIVYDVPEK